MRAPADVSQELGGRQEMERPTGIDEPLPELRASDRGRLASEGIVGHCRAPLVLPRAFGGERSGPSNWHTALARQPVAPAFAWLGRDGSGTVRRCDRGRTAWRTFQPAARPCSRGTICGPLGPAAMLCYSSELLGDGRNPRSAHRVSGGAPRAILGLGSGRRCADRHDR